MPNRNAILEFDDVGQRTSHSFIVLANFYLSKPQKEEEEEGAAALEWGENVWP